MGTNGNLVLEPATGRTLRRYPVELFKRIVASIDVAPTVSTSRCGANNSSNKEVGEGILAADIGCGTGQATSGLARYFGNQATIGIDVSEAQIQAAQRAYPDLKFAVGEATFRSRSLPFADQSLHCVTVAQGVHWFDDLPAFYSEVDRVLKPGGVLAIWCYGLPQYPTQPRLEHLINHDMYEVKLGTYWDERRRLVENLYRDVKTIDQFHNGKYHTEVIEEDDAITTLTRDVSKDDIIGYIRSWSAYTKYCEMNDVNEGSYDDPLSTIETYLADQTNCKQAFPIHTASPLLLLLSKKKTHCHSPGQQKPDLVSILPDKILVWVQNGTQTRQNYQSF
jgi:ubiquinone/menaquinone biosynthesis C-methylase UbiE